MKRFLQYLLLILGFIIFGVGGLYIYSHVNVQAKGEAIQSEPDLTLKSQLPLSPEEGERISQVRGCRDCHGADLAGQTFIDDPAVGLFASANLTKGKGGIGAKFADEDWVRAIRFGIGPNKKYLRFMPAMEFHSMSDWELGSLITYLKNMPAIDKEITPIKIGPIAKILYTLGKMPIVYSGEGIDRNQRPPIETPPVDSADFGQYMAIGCMGCHGQQLKGGPMPGMPPSWPKAADLSKTGRVQSWDFATFQKVIKEGILPDGRKLDPQYMPWTSFSAMKDSEISSLFNYLKSLPR